MKLNYAVFSTIGTVRRKNQDNFFVNGKTKPLDQNDMILVGSSQETNQLFAIADGMGGEEKGELAAFIAVERLKTLRTKDFHQDCLPYVEQTNNQICGYQNKHHLTMGSTIVTLSVQANEIHAMNIGDSRLYYIQKNGITQLSKDHSEYQNLVDCGVLKKGGSATRKSLNRLTQHFGIAPSKMVLEPYQTSIKGVSEGDFFLLCSDGLHSSVADEKILEAIVEYKNPDEICKQLVSLAEKNRSRDNITIMVVSVEETSTFQSIAVPKQRNLPAHTRSTHLCSILVAVFALLCIVGFTFGGFLYLNPIVPDSVGLTQQEGILQLEKSGFNVMVHEEFHDTIPVGTVVVQSLEAGERSVRNSTVVITVSKGVEKVEVICVEGMRHENAIKALNIQGFEVNETEEYSDTIGKGVVICQTPNNGILEKGSRIEISLSKGPEPITLPSLIGINVDDAVAQLQSLGLKAEVIEKYDDNIAKGQIIEQSPSSSEILTRGESVTLTSSKGQEPSVVPNIVGKSLNDAKQAIEQAGLKSEIKYSYSNTVNKGIVVYQYTASGTNVKRGSVVGFSISLGKRNQA